MAAARPVVATDLKRDPMARGRNGQADTSSATARALEREAREDVRGGRGVEWRAESGHQARSGPLPKKRKRVSVAKKLYTLLDLCVSSLRRGHANLLCIVPILTDDPRRESISWFNSFAVPVVSLQLVVVDLVVVDVVSLVDVAIVHRRSWWLLSSTEASPVPFRCVLPSLLAVPSLACSVASLSLCPGGYLPDQHSLQSRGLAGCQIAWDTSSTWSGKRALELQPLHLQVHCDRSQLFVWEL